MDARLSYGAVSEFAFLSAAFTGAQRSRLSHLPMGWGSRTGFRQHKVGELFALLVKETSQLFKGKAL
jgi:hypothetical protein